MGGRQPGTRGVFAIEEPELLLRDPIALDTSFVVEALISTQPLHSACSGFLRRLDDSGISITTSDLLTVELAEAIFAIALKERWGSRWRGHRADGRARRRAARLLDETIALRDDASSRRSLPGTPERCCKRRQEPHDQIRARLLRCDSRGQ